MQLIEVRLNNFCQHRDLAITFPPGITGILGGNGCGKSNAIKAIRFAILGESGNAGPKAEDMNWFAEEGSRGLVDWTFEKDGTEGKLRRFVSQTRASLKFGDDATLSATGAVNAKIMELMGVTKKTVEEIIFVMQGAIEQILFEKASERAKKFQGLFGTDGAEKIRTVLQQEIGKLSDDPVGDRLQRLEHQLADDIDVQLRSMNDQHAGLEHALADCDEEAAQDVLTRYEEWETESAAFTEASGRLSEAEASLARHTTELTGLTSTAEALQVQLDEQSAGGDNVNELLSRMEQAKDRFDRHQRLTQDHVRYTADAGTEAPQAPVVDREHVLAGLEEVAKSTALNEHDAALVALVQPGAQVACPMCEQPIANTAALHAKISARVAERQRGLSAAAGMLQVAQQKWRTYDEELISHASVTRAAEMQLKQVQTWLDELGEVEPVDVASVEELRQKSRSLVETQAALASATRRLVERQASVTAVQATVEAHRAEAGRLRQQGTGEAPTAEAYQNAKRMMHAADQARTQLATLDGQLTQLKDQRARVLNELEALRQRAGQLEAIRSYRSLCERARGVLHRDALPQVVAQAYLKRLNSAIAHYLVSFNVPFSAFIKDDLTVVCSIPGVGDKDARRLSGGQRVMLGIAFRFAVYNLFAPDLGFMVLDEPTTMLDDDSVAAVVELLHSVNSYAHRVGKQVVIITHESALIPTFDHVVRI